MSYNRNNKSRLPKQEYFAMRLEQAESEGLDNMADYYRSRLSKLKESETPKQERVTLKPVGLFGSRDTLQEAFDYAEMMAKSSESAIHAMTPVYVLYNTIAKQYDLVPKSK